MSTRAYRTHFVFFALSLLFGGFFVFGVPLGFSEDEPVHMFRAYAVSRGHLFAEPIGHEDFKGQRVTLYGNSVPRSIVALEQYTGAGTRADAFCKDAVCPKVSKEKQEETERLAAAPLRPGEAMQLHSWGASYYFFLPYIPAAVGVFISQTLDASTGHTVYLARLASLLAYSLIVTFALYMLRRSPVRWVVFTVGLLPASLAVAGAVNTDMLINALSLLFFSICSLVMFHKHKLKRWESSLLILVAILLPLFKLPYIALSFLVLFLPIYSQRKLLLRSMCAGAIVLPALLWTVATSDAAHTQAVMVNAEGSMPNMVGQIIHALTHPFEYIYVFFISLLRVDWFGQIGVLTHQRVPLPITLTLLWYILLALSALLAAAGLRKITPTKQLRSAGIILLSTGCIGILILASAMYASYNAVGSPIINGVQGRYLVPLLPFIILGTILLASTRLSLKPMRDGSFYMIHLALLAISCISYYLTVYS